METLNKSYDDRFLVPGRSHCSMLAVHLLDNALSADCSAVGLLLSTWNFSQDCRLLLRIPVINGSLLVRVLTVRQLLCKDLEHFLQSQLLRAID